MPRRAAILILVSIGAAVPAEAQQTPVPRPDPPGPYVIDVRGATIGAPQNAGFFPPVPSGTLIPSREFGFDLGGHVYLFQFGPARVGLGADLFRLRGTASPPEPVTVASTIAPTPSGGPAMPDIEATTTTLAPQISFNFGSAAGWSYLSAGVGRAQISTARSSFATEDAETRASGWLTSVNFGAGARWFTSDHLAFTFDLRFHLISAGKPQGLGPGSPKVTVVSAAAGISLR